MRTLKLHFPDQALPTLDTFLKQTKEARIFRRAQAVREEELCWHCWHTTVPSQVCAPARATCCWCGRTVGSATEDARKGQHGLHKPGYVRVAASG